MFRVSKAYNLQRKLSLPTTNITRHNVIPTSLPIPQKPSDSEKLHSLRIAVTPSFGYGCNTYETGDSQACSSSTLAGDPKHLQTRQDIRKEILEKWNKRPKPDHQREWLKNLMFN